MLVLKGRSAFPSPPGTLRSVSHNFVDPPDEDSVDVGERHSEFPTPPGSLRGRSAFPSPPGTLRSDNHDVGKDSVDGGDPALEGPDVLVGCARDLLRFCLMRKQSIQRKGAVGDDDSLGGRRASTLREPAPLIGLGSMLPLSDMRPLVCSFDC
jgi:hypothetical protein